MFSLCELLVETQGPMCPSLPGDPPFEETLIFISPRFLLLWSCIGTIGLIRARIQRRPPLTSDMVRTSLWLSGLLLLSIGYSQLMIRERNLGRWADLKRDLRVIEEDARHYIALRGPIDTEEEAHDFHLLELARGRNRSFTFGPGLPHVDIVYRWWWQRVTIIWDRGRSAAFDLDTMKCDGFD